MTDARHIVTFIDIDGVLLPRRQWYVPANAEALAAMSAIENHSDRARAAALVHFDPAAVALVNRLCALTGARIVTHSRWRQFDIDLRAKLVDEGLAEAHLHVQPICPWHSWRASKSHDINAFIEDHPADEYIVIDDDPIIAWNQDFDDERLVEVDPDDGFGVADYRIALSALGGVDPVFSIPPIAADDLAAVMHALGRGRMAALRWLHERVRSDDYTSCRAQRLDVGGQVEHFRQQGAFHDDADQQHEAEGRRAGVLAEISTMAASRSDGQGEARS